LYNFRLRSLEAPAGPATVGTSFTSTGTIPMSLRRFEDDSKVTVAQRPNTFEFVTNSTMRRGKRPMAATYRHRYEIAATPEGVLELTHAGRRVLVQDGAGRVRRCCRSAM